VERWKGGKVEGRKGGKVTLIFKCIINKFSKMKSYKELELWKVSMDLSVDIYQKTMGFPKFELYGLTSQLRRAAVSLPSNIAEGASRNSTKEFIQFLFYSNGSLSEVETQLEIASRLKYLSSFEELTSKIKLIRKMLINLIRALEK
jgi:four helix bundle protein